MRASFGTNLPRTLNFQSWSDFRMEDKKDFQLLFYFMDEETETLERSESHYIEGDILLEQRSPIFNLKWLCYFIIS